MAIDIDREIEETLREIELSGEVLRRSREAREQRNAGQPDDAAEAACEQEREKRRAARRARKQVRTTDGAVHRERA